MGLAPFVVVEEAAVGWLEGLDILICLFVFSAEKDRNS